MKASEAKEIANSLTSFSNARQIANIQEKIKDLANKGKYSFNIYENLSDVVVDKLKKDGYVVVSSHDPRDGICYNISWY